MKTHIIFKTLFLSFLLFGCSSKDTVSDPNGDIAFNKRLQDIIDSKVGTDKLVGVSVSEGLSGYQKRKGSLSLSQDIYVQQWCRQNQRQSLKGSASANEP